MISTGVCCLLHVPSIVLAFAMGTVAVNTLAGVYLRLRDTESFSHITLRFLLSSLFLEPFMYFYLHVPKIQKMGTLFNNREDSKNPNAI